MSKEDGVDLVDVRARFAELGRRPARGVRFNADGHCTDLDNKVVADLVAENFVTRGRH
ncbi:MAG: hypothetical protein QGG14_03660 [Planctomycetota bacterium]|nr:hypothetical protein [Planctomycetota bacterium]